MTESLLALPKVGERLMRTMTNTSTGFSDDGPEPCDVVYVNKPHRYYMVQFVESHIKESYKPPLKDE